MNDVALIGIDLGKRSFHLYGQDKDGRMVFQKPTRSQIQILLGNFPSCAVVMEACTGVHWITRRVMALGHQAKLISPRSVKSFVQGKKNDFADA